MVGGVILSVDEFSVYDTPDGKAELVRGELRLNPPPSFRRGRVIATIAQRLMSYVNSHGLGIVVVNAGFELVELPRTVRSPDLAFLRSDRVPDDDEGFALVWLVDPRTRTVAVIEGGLPVRQLSGADVLTGRGSSAGILV
jgi:Uma2 family endonuclease